MAATLPGVVDEEMTGVRLLESYDRLDRRLR
jgi:hypothetical protein